jgi:hypothetical protein
MKTRRPSPQAFSKNGRDVRLPNFQSYYSDGRSGNFSDAWPGLRLNREWTVKA